MKAGRGLDALIAEKVFGLEIRIKSNGEPYPVNPRTTNDDPPDDWGHVKHYSTDIAAAWLVVEKVKLFTDKMYVLSNDGTDWIISEEVNPSGAYLSFTRGESAPHAICLAALKLVE